MRTDVLFVLGLNTKIICVHHETTHIMNKISREQEMLKLRKSRNIKTPCHVSIAQLSRVLRISGFLKKKK